VNKAPAFNATGLQSADKLSKNSPPFIKTLLYEKGYGCRVSVGISQEWKRSFGKSFDCEVERIKNEKIRWSSESPI
jgi:hypothetical protein